MTDSSKPPKPADDTPASTAEDVVFLHSKTADGEGAIVLRKKGEQLSIGEIRPLVSGQSVVGEVVQLTPRAEGSALCDVVTLVEAPSPATNHRPTVGPSKVSTLRYRDGWDTLWGRRGRRGRRTRADSKKLN